MPKVLETCVATNLPTPPQSTAPRRIACDRCHGQKLKCPRDVEGASPCKRCAKAGAICQTSPARATGRPAKNPKQRPRKLESSDSVLSSSSTSRPSLSDSKSSSSSSSASSVDDDLTAPGAGLVQVMSHATMSTPEEYLSTPAMPSIPMAQGKYCSGSDMNFNFGVVDDAYPTPLNFQYDDGTNFFTFDSSTQSGMPMTYPQDPSLGMGFTYSDAEFGAMLPPPTPPLTEDFHDSGSDESRRTSNTTNSSHGRHSRNASTDSYHRPMLPTSTFSSPLVHSTTMSEDVLPMTSLPIRTINEGETASKKRRFSALASSRTPQNEMAWTSNLSHSQALSSIQTEVDNFSRTLMSQTMGPGKNDIINTDVVVDVGVLLPIADRFMALIPDICQRTRSRSITPAKRKNSLPNFRIPSLDRSQSEPEATTIEYVATDSKSLDSSLIQLIFACNTRLHLAFQIALDVISHNLTDPSNNMTSSTHPSSSIGSYKLPTSSPLSTLLHLHAISHSLDRLEVTLRRYLVPETSSSTAFFDGMFYNNNQKRNEMAIQAFRERAFEEASDMKTMLMSKIRDIVAEVGTEF